MASSVPEDELDDELKESEKLLGDVDQTTPLTIVSHQNQSNDKQHKQQQQQNHVMEIEMGRTISEITDKELDELVEHGTTASSSVRSSNALLDDVQDDDNIEEDNDMESLLANNSKTTSNSKQKEANVEEVDGDNDNDSENDEDDIISDNKKGLCNYCCCCNEPVIRVGNIRVCCPTIYAKTKGWGVAGPHIFGPPCIIILLLFASYYFIYDCSYKKHWYGATTICTIFAITTLYNLLNAAYRDPGVIVPGRLALPDPIPRSYRWCDTCNYHQPPSAAHCPDCDVCIAGFDHHCVWMGTCVGSGNFKPFMRFNLAWMAYLIYAIIWVSVIAPLTDHKSHHQSIDAED